MLARLLNFFRKRGFKATVQRCWVEFVHGFYLGRMKLYRCTLPAGKPANAPDVQIKRVKRGGVSAEYLDAIVGAGNSTTNLAKLETRFATGSELWMAEVNGRFAGFGWTIRGRTMEKHFFQLGPNEVHFFDFYVFPEFRGRGINTILLAQMLHDLGNEGVTRCHIECAAWNKAQIRSLGKTPFMFYAEVVRIPVGDKGRTLVTKGNLPKETADQPELVRN
ncbi:MAG: GCN5-related N-acetyltransferase [Verrucomicrobia bacterium]|nr:GCN5-related N-acetyltransferase [Verrucomicrobiota bacterium]